MNLEFNMEIKKEKPLVSVLVPAFNHEEYIIDTLESVLRQDYSNIELIICDDGSNDDTPRLAEEWVKTNCNNFAICKFLIQENKGICPTLNRLVKASSGTYIKPLASDDLLVDNALTILTEKASYREEKILVFSNILEFQDDKKECVPAFERTRRYDSEFLSNHKTLLNFELVIAWGRPFNNQFYSRSFYDEVGGYPENLFHEDYYFGFSGLILGCIVYEHRATLFYRTRKNTVTPGLSKEQYYGKIEAKALLNKLHIRSKKSLWWNVAVLNDSSKVARKIFGLVHQLIKLIFKKRSAT